jgi:negative regulator of replication initiation
VATVTARKVDDSDYAYLSEGAEENGRSISEELRALIAEYARKRKGAKVAAELRAFAEANPIKMRPGEDAVSLIRSIRDE